MNEEKELKNQIREVVEKELEKQRSLEGLITQQYTAAIAQVNNRVWVATVIIVAVIFLLGFFGYTLIVDTITSQIRDKLTRPEVERQVKQLVKTEIDPLQDRVENIKKDIADEQKRLEKTLRIQQLSVGARAGSAKDFDKLLKISKSENTVEGNFAKIAIIDLESYFGNERYSIMWIKEAPGTRRQLFMPVDEIAERLTKNRTSDNLTYIDAAGFSTKKYFVGWLVAMLPEQENLRSQTRIIKALEELADSKFSPLNFEAVTEWWGKNNMKKEYTWPFQPYFDGVEAMEKGDWQNALNRFDTMIKIEPEAIKTKIAKARVLTELGKFDQADKVFKEVENSHSDYEFLHVWRALYYIKQNNIADAIDSVNRSLEINRSIENDIRNESWMKPLLNNSEVNWSKSN